MMKRSWFYQNGFYYSLLAFILLLHIILLFMRFHKSQDLTDATGPSLKSPVKVQWLTREEFQKHKQQIVESEDKASLSTPPPSAFLSDRERSFDRQSRARKVAPFNQGGKRKRSKDLSLAELGAFGASHDPLKIAAKNYSQRKAGSGNGESSSSDYLESVPLGDLTYLNTTEYKYYGFFHRIKQKLEQFWGRSIHETAESLMSKGRSIASKENLITSLKVTMNQLGEIISISVEGSSGVRELDDAAIESFNQAGPFPNPPKGLIVDGKVLIEWGFVVNT